MALAKSLSISLFGLTGRLIEVEADISSNLPNFILVGLPDASLSEATSRVRAACTNSGLPLPGRRITVNLSPAAVPKRGSSFDLAIAVAVLAAAGSISSETAGAWLHIGELALDGSIRRVNGVLPSILAARELGWNHFVVPMWFIDYERTARWDRFGRPDKLPDLSTGFPTIWWWDEEKAKKVAAK